MIHQPDNLKPERIQNDLVPVTPDRLRSHGASGEWQVDDAPSAIVRHFPQPSFQSSSAFLMQVAARAEKHGRTPFTVVDDTGVTVRLGSPPRSGVTEADLDLAADLNAIA